MPSPYIRCLVGAALLAAALSLSLLPRAGSAQGGGRGPEYLPGRYVVVLKDGLDAAAVGAELTRRHGLSVGHVYRSALTGFSAVIPDARLDVVVADPRIAYVERDRIIRLDPDARPGGGSSPKSGSQKIPWGIDRIGARASSALSGNGSGEVNVDIAILDTGIDAAHPDLNVAGGANFAGGPNGYLDGNGHGTHVAGTAAARDNSTGVVGVAPGARLWAVRVLDNAGYGTYEGILAGIDWVTERAATIDVANMSLSGGGSALNEAVNAAVAAGIVFVVAAGNDGMDASLRTPAGAEQAITVSALTQSNTFAYFSNFGPVVDLIAPGVSVLSTWKGGGTKSISGTSMAAPHVAGAAALYRLKNPGVGAKDVGTGLRGLGETPPGGTWSGDPDGTGEPLVKVDEL